MRFLAAALICVVGTAAAGDSLPVSLTGAKGDPARGRAIVTDRQVGMCLLCHSGPFPEQPFQGNLARDLSNAARLGEAEIRLRIVDSARIDPGSIMPAYYRSESLARVAAAYRGKTILTATQVEDVVAFLLTLRD